MAIKREDRYVVIKLSDMDNSLNSCERAILGEICGKVNYYRECMDKEKLECLVIESDWPEYDTAWTSIVKRMG